MFAVNRFVVATRGTVSTSAHSRRGAAPSSLSGSIGGCWPGFAAGVHSGRLNLASRQTQCRVV